MSSSVKYLVPVEPASGHGEVVIIHVEQQGSHPLDIRLVGSEGESPYVTSLQHRHVAALRHKFKGSDDEWAAILSHFLLQQQPDIGQSELLQGVRMVYQLRNKQLEISFRQHVQNIKVTLGEIILPEDDEFEFNPFEWVQTSAVAHAETLQQMAVLKAKINSEHDTIAKLHAQLDDFIKTKNETETAMLQQFMTLLNEKKRKIRDQSRLLAGVKVDEAIGGSLHIRVVINAKHVISSRCPANKGSYHQRSQGRRVTSIQTQSSCASTRARCGARVRQRPDGNRSSQSRRAGRQ
ncbi:XRCC4 domain containing protein [Pyrenophora tritici-repentis]|nr:XRCC4 domain containing protein [Pyrenophora tritici-repentis]KAI1564329.1 XRCC4 domain containing protein [Pyrenophora tritici-repentis]KAI1568439.1 XRCC4 domain containing protein [Pyrenophora tritici-repentis]